MARDPDAGSHTVHLETSDLPVQGTLPHSISGCHAIPQTPSIHLCTHCLGRSCNILQDFRIGTNYSRSAETDLMVTEKSAPDHLRTLLKP